MNPGEHSSLFLNWTFWAIVIATIAVVLILWRGRGIKSRIEKLLAIVAGVLLVLYALSLVYRGVTPSTRTVKTRSQAFSIQVLGNYNRVYVVFGANMKNTDNILLLANHSVHTIVVIKCPVNVVFGGDHNEVIIDSALREFVKVQDHGKSNSHTFSD
jgi:hypothetical protein